MPRKPVDVDQYERTRNGQSEHVSDYTRMQDVRDGPGAPPAFTALRRKTRTGDPAVTTETDFKGFQISAKIVESGVQFPNDPDDRMQHNHFKVKVKNLSTGVSRSFDYFGSQNDYQIGKEEMDRNDLLESLRSFLEDAQMGGYDFETFADEMGLDTDSRRAEKMWRGIKGESRKADALGLGDEVDEAAMIADIGVELGE